MASRLPLAQERKLPNLNFKLKFFINFSISSNKKLGMDFATFCGNDDETVSQELRKIVFSKLNIKDQKEFDKMFIEESNYIKDKIKAKMKEINKYEGNNWFSTMIRDEINKRMKSNAK